MDRKKIVTTVWNMLLILVMCMTGIGREKIPLTQEAEAAAPYLKITAIDYGGSGSVCGDATLLESAGQYLLIDTGDKDGSNTVIRYLKQRGARNLSLYISHYHVDHCYYAAAIIRDPWFRIKTVYLANPDPMSRYVTSYYKKKNRKVYKTCKSCLDRYRTIVSAAAKRKVPVKRLKRGDSFSIGSAGAKVLWDRNTRGVGSFDPYDKNGDSYVNNNSLVNLFNDLCVGYQEEMDFNDMLDQLDQVRNMGPIKGILSKLPGIGNKVDDMDINERVLDWNKAIILSMTPAEREHPGLLNPSRKRRIAAGSGRPVEEVNRLIKQLEQTQKMMRQFTSKGKKGKQLRKMLSNSGNMGGMPPMGGGFPGM